MSLFDTFQAKKQRQAAAAAPKQEQIQSALQTKATGKVASGAGPKASNVGEAQALQTAKVQQKALTQQGAAQEQDLRAKSDRLETEVESQQKDLDQQAEQQSQKIDVQESTALKKIDSEEKLQLFQQRGNETLQVAAMAHKANEAFYQIARDQKFNTKNLVHGLETSRAQLDSDKNLAIYDQRAFLASMRSKEYVNKINRVGKLQKLNNAANFAKESAKIQMGHRAAMMQEELASKSARAADQRVANRAEAEAQANAQIAVAMEMMKDDLKKMRFEAGSKAVMAAGMAGLQAYQSGYFDSHPDVDGTAANSYGVLKDQGQFDMDYGTTGEGTVKLPKAYGTLDWMNDGSIK